MWRRDHLQTRDSILHRGFARQPGPGRHPKSHSFPEPMVVVEEEVEMVGEVAKAEMEEMEEALVKAMVSEPVQMCHSSDSTVHTIRHIQLEMSSQEMP